MHSKFLLAVGTTALVIACGSVPSVTFEDVEGGTAGDGSVVTSQDDGGFQSSKDSGFQSSKDSGSGFSKDSGSGGKDSGNNTCGANAGNNEICCGSVICRDCTPQDCGKCSAANCQGSEICCSKGMSIQCKSGQAC